MSDSTILCVFLQPDNFSLTHSSIRIYFSSLNVSFSTTASPALRRGCGEGAGVYPSSLGVKAGSQPGQAASSSQGLRGRQTTICVCSYGQLAVPSSPHVHVFGLWGESGVPDENPFSHRENEQTPHSPQDGAPDHLIGQLCFKKNHILYSLSASLLFQI